MKTHLTFSLVLSNLPGQTLEHARRDSTLMGMCLRAPNLAGVSRTVPSKLERHFVLNRKRVLGAMHQISDCFVYSALPASVGGANDVTENGNSGLSCQGSRNSAFDSGLTNAFKISFLFNAGRKLLLYFAT